MRAGRPLGRRVVHLPPLLAGAVGHGGSIGERPLTARVRQVDGGDHLIFLGEVEEYRYNDGEPLVFHSGRYRVATRHPDITD